MRDFRSFWSPHSNRLPAVAVVLMVNGGCAPTAHLSVPYTVASDSWNDDAVTYQGASQDVLSWSAFGSDELASLIQQAQRANPDIAIASARILQARGDLRVARSAKGPVVDFSTDSSTDVRNLQGLNSSSNRLGSAELNISYDLDLFGGNRASQRAAQARFRATGYDRLATKIAIEADVASAYVEIATLTDQIALTERALRNARKLENIIKLRAIEGLADPIEAGLQASEANEIEVDMSRLVEAKAIARNALSTLLGEEAPTFALKPASISSLAAPRFNAAQPSNILVRRPDILAAEARIAAANGNIGEARAAFFPQISFSGSSFLDFTSGGIGVPGLALGANVISLIFDNGRRKGDFMRAEGEQIEATEFYRKTVLNSLNEAQNALVSSSQSQKRLTLLENSRGIAARTAVSARRKYLEGSIGFNTLFESERNLLTTEGTLIRAKQENLQAAISLFKALGGAPE
jgi:NodT family efflux transporter outer membrane factor (OMF) lipoprotein